jgi:preprotein translocase subunit YajC
MLIPFAHAAAPAPEAGMLSFLPMIIILIVFWFLMIRPQMKKAKEHQNLLAGLQKGDEVVTNGGVLGKVVQVQEQLLTLEIARGVEIQVQKHAVQQVLPKGSLKF